MVHSGPPRPMSRSLKHDLQLGPAGWRAYGRGCRCLHCHRDAYRKWMRETGKPDYYRPCRRSKDTAIADAVFAGASNAAIMRRFDVRYQQVKAVRMRIQTALNSRPSRVAPRP